MRTADATDAMLSRILSLGLMPNRRVRSFDRELTFPMPNIAARARMLRMHTNSWDPPIDGLSLSFLPFRLAFRSASPRPSSAGPALLLAPVHQRAHALTHGSARWEVQSGTPSGVVQASRIDYVIYCGTY